MKVPIVFCSCFLIDLGICWTCARYCVKPPTIICTNSSCPSMEGFALSHLLSAESIFSVIGDQGVVAGASFPSHAPNIHIDSLSFVMCTLSGIFSWVFLACLSCMNFSLKALLPIGRICVLDVLNCAPVARHH